MTKIIPFVAAIAVLALATTASPPNRYVDFFAAGIGEELELDVKGVALLSYNDSTGWSRFTVTIQGLQPHTTYNILLGNHALIACAFTTNSRGSAGFADELSRQFPDDIALHFFVRDAPCHEFLEWSWELEHEELHAIGVPIMD